ncbi:MAG TPA: SDR family NAD(P)-dependent oxidoreductase, partial [Bacteroidales bacterium]|nr:SDR family NAD(P)-dependent oxidoreductase [Bacteroidales bacterium]
MKKLENKITIITGGADGIGKAAVKRFAEEGASVVIWDMNEPKGIETRDLLVTEGLMVDFMKVNTSDFVAVEAAAKNVFEKYGQIHILVNNAGINRDSTLKKMTVEQWQSV